MSATKAELLAEGKQWIAQMTEKVLAPSGESQAQTDGWISGRKRRSTKNGDREWDRDYHIDSAELAKAQCKAELLEAVRTMRDFVAKAERWIAQENETPTNTINRVMNELAWGMANASTHLQNAVRENTQMVASVGEANVRNSQINQKGGK